MYFQVIRGDINVNKSIIHEDVLNLDTTRDGLCGTDGDVLTQGPGPILMYYKVLNKKVPLHTLPTLFKIKMYLPIIYIYKSR